MAQGQKGVNWCFTINHWTEDDKDRIEAAQALGSFSYIVVGEEVGARNAAFTGFLRNAQTLL